MTKGQDIFVGICVLIIIVAMGALAYNFTREKPQTPSGGATSSFDQPVAPTPQAAPEPAPVGCPHGDCKG